MTVCICHWTNGASNEYPSGLGAEYKFDIKDTFCRRFSNSAISNNLLDKAVSYITHLHRMNAILSLKAIEPILCVNSSNGREEPFAFSLRISNRLKIITPAERLETQVKKSPADARESFSPACLRH
mmetsp:Transcript_129000/g.223876  ORF Transcript_129000/g.223876 Transcript_129000/m.223876 type:complete len:126 (-) Transcript_129000:1086-1463(-)